VAVERCVEDESLLASGNRSANRCAVGLRQPNVAVWEQLNHYLTRSDRSVEVSYQCALVIARDVEPYLSKAFAPHPVNIS